MAWQGLIDAINTTALLHIICLYSRHTSSCLGVAGVKITKSHRMLMRIDYPVFACTTTRIILVRELIVGRYLEFMVSGMMSTTGKTCVMEILPWSSRHKAQRVSLKNIL